jgi:hypothetical protein
MVFSISGRFEPRGSIRPILTPVSEFSPLTLPAPKAYPCHRTPNQEPQRPRANSRLPPDSRRGPSRPLHRTPDSQARPGQGPHRICRQGNGHHALRAAALLEGQGYLDQVCCRQGQVQQDRLDMVAVLPRQEQQMARLRSPCPRRRTSGRFCGKTRQTQRGSSGANGARKLKRLKGTEAPFGMKMDPLQVAATHIIFSFTTSYFP